jgi:hypothetical protein
MPPFLVFRRTRRHSHEPPTHWKPEPDLVPYGNTYLKVKLLDLLDGCRHKDVATKLFLFGVRHPQLLEKAIESCKNSNGKEFSWLVVPRALKSWHPKEWAEFERTVGRQPEVEDVETWRRLQSLKVSHLP